MHTLILGFDSFDPTIFENLAAQGKMPILGRMLADGKYSRFTVSDPPQTEVSWTSIASGANPGVHGVFDFVHRDPASYTPYVSLLPTQSSKLGVQFVSPSRANTIFAEAAAMGYPSTSLWWPATFPAKPESPVRTIPGLGAPDLLGRLGVGTLLTDDPDLKKNGWKTAVSALQAKSEGAWRGLVDGPRAKQGTSVQAELLLEKRGGAFSLSIGKQKETLKPGEWSPMFEIEFKMGLLFTIKAVTRALLSQTEPHIRLYLLPLQMHPLASAWRYATPPGFVKDAWNNCGPFLTLGWPQDTTGLEEGHMNDEQFLALCESISQERECVLMRLMEKFDEGVLGIVFDDLDRIQHMFRRDRPEVVDAWYQKLDALVGRVQARLQAKNPRARLLVLSDHGFSAFDYKVHVNRWLLDHGYLVAKDGADVGAAGSVSRGDNTSNDAGSLEDVDWAHTQAYAVGLNSIYLNLQGREGQGSVPVSELESLLAKLRPELLAWVGPDGRAVLQRVLLKHEAFSGALTPYGPDLVLGYTPGYRASSETGLGKWESALVSENHDHWGADHCIDSQAVPGVIFSNLGLHGLENPSYLDIPMLTLGKALKQANNPPPPPSAAGGEDKAVLEERLKSLGYL